MTTLTLRCRCGAVRGELAEASPSTGNHVVCYCDDCQALMTFLDRQDLLDPHGGSTLFQTWPSRVRITAGQDQLRAVRLSAKGMTRWYACCCKTPVGNMMSWARPPFIGIHRAFATVDSAGWAETVGPITGYTFGKFAKGGCPDHAKGVPWRAIRVGVGVMASSWFQGGHGPNPFQNGPAGPWIVEPQVLSPAERSALAAPPEAEASH